MINQRCILAASLLALSSCAVSEALDFETSDAETPSEVGNVQPGDGGSIKEATPAEVGDEPSPSVDGGSLDDTSTSLLADTASPTDGAPSADVGSVSDVPKTGPAHPFGAHDTKYATGTILPSGDAAARDAATSSFYDAWKKRHLVAGCGTGRYYVNVGDAGGGGMAGSSISVSEGHGYGMMIVALMAGHDPNARTIFDGLYAFFRDHPSTISKDLMAWNQVVGCASTKDADSATDGDLDIAHGLLLAHAQWGSGGSVDYLGQAKKVIAAIKARDIHATTKLTTLGDWVSPTDAKYGNSTRPSDFHLDQFRSFGVATGDSFWTSVVDAHATVIDKLITGYAPSTGLLPDFVVDTKSTPKPAPAGFLEASTDGAYSWNACRVPWRLGTDFLMTGDAARKAQLAKLNAWIVSKTGSDPSKIDDGYQLSGAQITSGIAYEMAFVAPFGVAAMSEAKNQAWLDAIWKSVAGKSITASEYYGNTIKLLTMIVMSGNWVRG